ncbi:MAG: M4 family metallopeptidase [Chitinophagales bacterium]
MKQFYTLIFLCVLSNALFITTDAQVPTKLNTIEGSVWINPHLRSSEVHSEKVPLLIEKVTDESYRLCSEIGTVKLFTIMAFEKNCESEESCGISFNENCEAICNSDCSYVNALTGNPEKMPLVTYQTSNFPNTSCFRKVSNTHWYALKSLDFANKVLNFNNIGIGNTQTVYARYSPIGHWGSSSADDFGVTMNAAAANWPDAICHEWGHYINNQITQGAITHNNGSTEILAMDEGLADIWSTLIRSYLEEGEDIEAFKTTTPDYRMWAVNRNFANTYKPYNTCSILSDDLPSYIKTQAWTIGDSHIKGLTLSHWFYLLSEGTKGNVRTIRVEVPENESAILTTSMCSSGSFVTKEKTIQFDIEGIGHFKTMQIIYEALSIIGEDESLQPLTFPKFRCATEKAVAAIFPEDCHVLQQVNTAWYAMNVGESYDVEVPNTLTFCEGEEWNFSLQNENIQSMGLYAPNGELLADGNNSVNFLIQSLNATSIGTYELRYTLNTNCNTELSQNCEWMKTIEVAVENAPLVLTEIPTQNICESESIDLDAADFIKADSYQWQTANGELLSNEATLNFEPTSTTSLQLIATNNCGTSELTTEIEVGVLPQILAEIPEQTVCETEIVTLNAADFVEADSYQWQTANGELMSEEAVLSFEAITTTSLQLIGKNDCGSETLMSNIEVHELPKENEILLQANNCESNEITLWVDGLYETYAWNGTNVDENALTVSEAGTYELTVSNEQGCSQTMSIEVMAEDFSDLGIDFEAGYVVSSDEVWKTEGKRIRGKLIVPSGRTLEIEGVEIEFLNEASGIVVEEGGVLKVKNAVFKGNQCENRMWNGILAKGDAYKTQTQIEYQSQVHLTDATIQDAYIGVEMGEGYSDGFLATGGGVLLAENTQFVNNSVGVLFHAYLNKSHSKIAENCAFVFNDTFKGIHHIADLGYIGVLAINIGGIEVKNTTFKNEQNNEAFTVENGGVGIVSWHAPMHIGTGNVDEENSFVNLYKGIDAYSTSTILGYMMIEGNRFEGVAKGIHLRNNHFSSVVGNHFEKIQAKNGYGLYVQEAEGATVANNTFEAAKAATEDSPFWGMIVENSGYYGCTVYNNEFTKKGNEDKFFAAVQFEGDDNPNTLIDCNRFEAISNYDLLLLGDSKRHFSEEGGCDEFDPLISPLKNQWHTLCDNVDTYHLYHNDSEASINWTFAPGFAPNCYSNNIQPIICEDDDNDCSLGGFGQMSGKDESDILSNLETAITPQEHNLAISQLVRYHLKTNELSTAIRTLKQDKQGVSQENTTKVLSIKKGLKNELPIFNRALLKKEILPRKPQKDDNDFYFIRQRQAPIFTNSTHTKQIRLADTDVELVNRHVKVKFNRSVNHFEGMDVVAIIADMNGRVLHHEQIIGENSEYTLDRELIAGEKYIYSLWINGDMVKSRKLSYFN